MTTKAISLLALICLVTRASSGGEAIATFAKQTLGIDLGSIPFGLTTPTNGEYGKVDAPPAILFLKTSAEISWMTNTVSLKYNLDFSSRVLRYGFRDGKLYAINIFISSFTPAVSLFDKTLLKQRQQELVKIQEELLKANPSHSLNFDDGSYQIRYGAMCAPTPESLFTMELEITPVARKKSA